MLPGANPVEVDNALQLRERAPDDAEPVMAALASVKDWMTTDKTRCIGSTSRSGGKRNRRSVERRRLSSSIRPRAPATNAVADADAAAAHPELEL